MGELTHLEDIRPQLDFERPIINPSDMPLIRQFRERFGEVVWIDYLKWIIKAAKNGRNILSEENIQKYELPYHLRFHLNKTNAEWKIELVWEINNILKTTRKAKLRIQLFHLRTILILESKSSAN